MSNIHVQIRPYMDVGHKEKARIYGLFGNLG